MNDEPEQDRPEAGGSEEVQPETQPPGEQAEEVLSQEPVAEAPAKKPWRRAWRIACLVFVVLAAVAIVLEMRARRDHARTIEQIEEAFEKAQQAGTGLYRDDLEKLIQGNPSKEIDEQKGTETFTWRGMRPHRLEVKYGRIGFVESFEAL